MSMPEDLISMVATAITYRVFCENTKVEEHLPVAVITLDGLIGAGKSSFLDDLQSFARKKVYVAPEPVCEWQDELKQAYEGTGSAYVLQKKILNCLAKRLVTVLSDPAIKGKIVVFERSATSCRMFIEITKDKFTEKEIEKLDKTIECQEAIMKSVHSSGAPHFRAYMDGTVDLCMTRISERQRDGESNITREYLYRLLEQQFLSFGIRGDPLKSFMAKSGFAYLHRILTPFVVPSITEEGQEGRKRRVEEFIEHVKFIRRQHCLAGQLHRFQ